MEIMNLINALPGAAAQGLIWGIMAIGVYLTYRILDVADLTVDGTMCTGGAVCIILMLNGCNVWVAMLAATGAGARRSDNRYLSYLYGNPCHPGRYPHTAFPVFCKLKDHGKSESGDQRR